MTSDALVKWQPSDHEHSFAWTTLISLLYSSVAAGGGCGVVVGCPDIEGSLRPSESRGCAIAAAGVCHNGWAAELVCFGLRLLCNQRAAGWHGGTSMLRTVHPEGSAQTKCGREQKRGSHQRAMRKRSFSRHCLCYASRTTSCPYPGYCASATCVRALEMVDTSV